jgi:hypothetical protein
VKVVAGPIELMVVSTASPNKDFSAPFRIYEHPGTQTTYKFLEKSLSLLTLNPLSSGLPHFCHAFNLEILQKPLPLNTFKDKSLNFWHLYKEKIGNVN